MRRHQVQLRSESGAVLVSGLLLSLAVLIVLGAAVDIGQAFIVRRELASIADQAALTASQALDTEALRAGRLALDSETAQQVAVETVAGEPAIAVETSATEVSVTVRVERRFPTILLRLVGLETLTVAAQATAEPRAP